MKKSDLKNNNIANAYIEWRQVQNANSLKIESFKEEYERHNTQIYKEIEA